MKSMSIFCAHTAEASTPEARTNSMRARVDDPRRRM